VTVGKLGRIGSRRQDGGRTLKATTRSGWRLAFFEEAQESKPKLPPLSLLCVHE
jgi:hypothetical protein